MAQLLPLPLRQYFGGRLQRNVMIVYGSASGSFRALEDGEISNGDALQVSQLPVLTIC